MRTDQPWMEEAVRSIGIAEVPGPKHNPIILKWLNDLHAGWQDDETPWCGIFAAHCFEFSALPYPKLYARAKSWATFGTALTEPVYGCIVVFERPGGGGHVAFFKSKNADGSINCLGGNQKNQVMVSKFVTDRVIAYRYPAGFVPPSTKVLVENLEGSISTNEA